MDTVPLSVVETASRNMADPYRPAMMLARWNRGAGPLTDLIQAALLK